MTERGDSEGTRSGVPCPLLTSSELLAVLSGKEAGPLGILTSGELSH